MIALHHLNNSRSQRILWMLEELGLPYEVKRYQRDAKTMLAPAELRDVHPLGKSPVITDDGLTVAESGAIVAYLADRYGKGQMLAAHGSVERMRQDYWLHYAEGSAMPPLLLKLVFRRVATTPVPFFIKPVVKGIAARVQDSFVDPQIALHLDYMEGELGKHAWFGGDTFSAADIQMSFPLEAAAARGGLDAGRPKLWAFLQRIHALPAYSRALAKGGDYRLG
jgi:glutathione S-transferase